MNKYAIYAANWHAENNPATKLKLEQKNVIRAIEQVTINNTLSFSKFSVETELNDSSQVTLVFTWLSHRQWQEKLTHKCLNLY